MSAILYESFALNAVQTEQILQLLFLTAAGRYCILTNFATNAAYAGIAAPMTASRTKKSLRFSLMKRILKRAKMTDFLLRERQITADSELTEKCLNMTRLTALWAWFRMKSVKWQEL